MTEEKKKVDAYGSESDKPGFIGVLEGFFKNFRNLGHMIVVLILLFVVMFCVGTSLIPAVALYHFVTDLSETWPTILRYAALASAFGAGYFLYGFSIIFVVPLINLIVPLKVKRYRGPWQSLDSIPWYVHNALNQIVRYTFLELITPTPLNILYYRMMGMKIGKGVAINTTNISDPCMIQLDDYVTIGGSATIFAHYAQKGFLIIEPVHIKKGANIGLKSSIMGDVVIGEGAKVLAHAVVLPKTRIEDGETFK